MYDDDDTPTCPHCEGPARVTFFDGSFLDDSDGEMLVFGVPGLWCGSCREVSTPRDLLEQLGLSGVPASMLIESDAAARAQAFPQ